MSDTIGALFGIMLDEGEYLSRRIEAAGGILAFESPDDAVEIAKSWLRGVFEDRTNSSRDKLRAIELIKKAEDRKTAPPATANEMSGLAERIRVARLEYLKTLPPYDPPKGRRSS
jgi:hypothetical protein